VRYICFTQNVRPCLSSGQVSLAMLSRMVQGEDILAQVSTTCFLSIWV